MTTQQIAPPAQVPSYVPAWEVYFYDSVGYVTYNGRVIARETCPTTAQQDRLVATRDRLNHRTAAH